MTITITRDRVFARSVRRTAALVAASALAIGLVAAVAPAQAAGEVPQTGLVAEYVFDQTTGSEVPNTAPDAALGAATVVNAADNLWTGTSLSFTGGPKSSTTANYVRLPNDILAGENSATVITEVQIDASMKTSYNFLWNVGNTSTTQYYFVSVRDNSRTAITTSSNGGERSARSTSGLVADRWYSLASVIDGQAGTITYFIDGVQVASTATSLTPASITDQSFNTIGRAPWADPHFKGEVSAFRVYDRALDATEVAAVSEADAALNPDAIAAAADEIAAGLGAIVIETTSATLPDAGGAVAWASDDPRVIIGADGVTATATLPTEGEETVTLTATVSVRGVEQTVPVEATLRPVSVPTDGLVAEYRLDATSGTTVSDTSGNGLDAQVEGTPDWSGAGMRFTGSNYVSLPDGVAEGLSKITVTTQFYPLQAVANRNVFLWNLGGSGTNATGQFFTSMASGGRTAISSTNFSGEQSRQFSPEFTAETWQNAAVTLDGAANTLTLYLDGEQAGRWTDVTLTPADLTDHTLNLLGASAYSGDAKFQGQISRFRIYDRALAADEIVRVAESDDTAVRNDPEGALTLVRQDAADIAVPATVYGDLVLPTSGAHTSIAWESSAPGVVAADGTVARPAEGQPDATVTLTATLSYAGDEYEPQSLQQTYTVVVAAEDASELDSSVVVPRFIVSDLPQSVGERGITWSSVPEGIVASDGTVAEVTESTDVTVTAVVDGGPTVTAAATVEPRGGDVLSYVIAGGNVFEGEDLLSSPDSRRSDALHVASWDGENWTPLNNEKAILYVQWDGDQKSEAGKNWQMGSPTFYRDAEGGIGVVASANNSAREVYVWDAAEGGTFTNERKLVVGGVGSIVHDPSLVYDAAVSVYKLFWTDQNGQQLVSVFASLATGATPQQTSPAARTETPASGTLPARAVAEESRLFTLAADEYTTFMAAYARLQNTGVEEVSVEADSWDEVELPETATLEYNDGSTKDLGVQWSEQQLQAAKDSGAGTYEITGEVQTTDDAYPFIEERADPHVFYNEDDGYYYATGSYYEPGCGPVCDGYTSYGALGLRRAESIAGLKDAPESLLRESLSGDRWGGNFWAPEFHKINGTWYIVVGAHDFGETGYVDGTAYQWVTDTILIPFLGTEQDVRDGKMLDPAYWGDDSQIQVLEGAPSFDNSYFFDEDSGQGYWILPRGNRFGIVKAVTEPGAFPAFDGSISDVKYVEWPWEYGVQSGSITATNPEGIDQPVIEGPYLFEYGDYYYITYSGGTVDKYYNLGVMRAPKGSDISDPDSWTESAYPGLMSYDTYEGEVGGAGHVGGGHNSVLIDEYGNLVLAYHARPYPDPNAGVPGNGGLWDPSRHTAIKSINVRSDGWLALDVTPDEEVAPASRTVTATVTVRSAPEQVTAVASARCVAAKVYVVVKLQNVSDVPLETQVTFGTTTRTAELAAGRSTSYAFASRVSTLPAGTVTGSATDPATGATSTFGADYPSVTCG